MASGAASFEMGFVIGLNCVTFGALVANPLLVIAVLSSEVLLDANKITEGVAGVMVQAAWLWAHEHPLLYDRSLSLQQLPRHLVPSPVHLQVLVSLKSLVADLTNVTIRFQ